MTQPVQQVVVMQPISGANGGETHMGTNQPQQTVVVVQQQPQVVTGTTAPDAGDRYPRWAYCIFGVGNFMYHFFWFWFFLVAGLLGSGSHYGTLLFFCGAVPALITFIWLINDSTVFCSNPGTGMVKKMCCCECINGWVMAVPIAIAAGLRLILWFSFFGILVDILTAFDAEEGITHVFWIILSIGSFDVGPLVLLAIDWWYYYGRHDYDGLLGTKLFPLRCITGEAIVVMITSWALIGFFEELVGDGYATYIWPWILHGIVAIAIIVFAAFLQFSGSITGNKVSNSFFKLVCWGLGIAQGILILIVWGYIFTWAFGDFGGFWVTVIFFIIYGTYYSGMTVPIVWACFSFQVDDNNGV